MDRHLIIPRQCQDSQMESIILDNTQRVCCIQPTPSTVETSHHPGSHPTQTRAALSKGQEGHVSHTPSTTTTLCHPVKGLLDMHLHLTLITGMGVTRYPRTPRTRPSSPCRQGPSLRPGPTQVATDLPRSSSGSLVPSPHPATMGAPSSPHSLRAGRAAALLYHHMIQRIGSILATPTETSQWDPSPDLPATRLG